MISGNDADTAAPAELFDAGDEISVRKDIIAFRFHHHHEIALAFHVKQHFGLAFALEEEGVQIIDGRFAGGLKRVLGCGSLSAAGLWLLPAVGFPLQ